MEASDVTVNKNARNNITDAADMSTRSGLIMGKKVVILCAILSAAATVESIERNVKYSGYSVLRAIPSNETQLKAIREMSEYGQLDFWLGPTSRLNIPSDVMVPPSRRKEVEDFFKQRHIDFSVLIEDLQKILNEESFPDDKQYLARGPPSFFHDYQGVDEIHNYINFLKSEYPTLAKTFYIGKSYEQLDMKLIKIGKIKETKKPAIWIDAGIHAREWIAPSTALYIATQLLSEYENDKVVKEIVDSFDWYILPLANPDGYQYSRTTNRFWRKTRSRTLSLWRCKGVDMNRNFGYMWNVAGASNEPCSEIFAGRAPFSEPETTAMSEYLRGLKGDLKLYLTFHSYGQYWLTPWGYTTALPPNYHKMESLAKAAAASLKKKYGTKYQIGSSTNVLYAAAGGSDDWALGVLGVNYSYTVELRDEGRYGFVLPQRYIIPVGEETWEGIKTMASILLSRISENNNESLQNVE